MWQYIYRTLIPLVDNAFGNEYNKQTLCSSKYERECGRDRNKMRKKEREYVKMYVCDRVGLCVGERNIIWREIWVI